MSIQKHNHWMSFLCGWICLLGAVGVSAAEILPQLQTRLQRPDVLRGHFEQVKQVAGFKKPLVSKGDFLVAKDRGVQWLTQSPFAASLVLTRERILAKQANGQTAYRLDTGNEPGVRAVNEVLFALLAGDVSILSQHFRLQGELVGAENWKLTLIPAEAAIGKLFQRIDLAGDRYVRTVHIQETSGDSSQIRFTDLTVEPGKLSAEEAHRFE